MKKLLVFLLLSASLALGQGAQRIGVAAVNSGGFLKVLSGAAITVCQYNPSKQCMVLVTTYQDPYLVLPNPTTFYADANGNYTYFVPPANVYLERVCSPGTPCVIKVVSMGFGSSAAVSINGSSVSAPNFNSSAPAPGAGYTALPFVVSGNNVIVEAPFGSPPVIGGTTPNAATFTNLIVTGTCTGCNTGSVDWANPGAIGSGTPNTGMFTSLTSTSGVLNGTVGALTPNTGSFTTVNASSFADAKGGFKVNGTAVVNSSAVVDAAKLGATTGVAPQAALGTGSVGAGNKVLLDNQTFGQVPVAGLVSSATTVNGQTCTLGSTCTIPSPTIAYTNTVAGRTTAITDTNMAAVGGSPLLYRFSGTINCTTTSSAATATLNLKWTDSSNTVQTQSVTATCTTLGSSSVGQITYTLRARNATNVTFGVTIANTPTYDVDVRLETM